MHTEEYEIACMHLHFINQDTFMVHSLVHGILIPLHKSLLMCGVMLPCMSATFFIKMVFSRSGLSRSLQSSRSSLQHINLCMYNKYAE